MPVDQRPPHSLTEEARSLRLGWLIGLRWLAVLGQLVTMGVTSFWLGVELPWFQLGLVLLAEVATNSILHAWSWARKRSQKPPSAAVQEQLQLLVMVADTVLLVLLLQLTGGLDNPFAAFLSVHIVMAAVLLPQPLAFVGAGFAVLCLAVLLVSHRELPVLLENHELRLLGHAVALGMTMVITVYFVTRVTRALALQSEELARERERQSRTERLEALGTLAAGAAHELATPLSTIAVVAKELERRLERSSPGGEDEEDARLIRGEVARCRRILDRMSMESGDRAGEAWVTTTLGEIVDETLEDFAHGPRVEVVVTDEVDAIPATMPLEALAMALRNLLSNAVDATPGERSIVLEVRADSGAAEFIVQDRGVGMDPEGLRRATDPFFTTKEVGQGMGLGLFLVRSVAERLEGTLRLDSQPGAGTTVSLRLPLDPRAGGIRGTPPSE